MSFLENLKLCGRASIYTPVFKGVGQRTEFWRYYSPGTSPTLYFILLFIVYVCDYLHFMYSLIVASLTCPN